MREDEPGRDGDHSPFPDLEVPVIDSSAATTTPGRSADDQSVGRSARTARRWVLVVAPTLAGLLAIGGAVADPAVDLDGAGLYELYAANPGPLQWKSVLYHFSYAVWGLAALMLVAAVRRRGSWLANVGGLLAFLGISSLPGFLLADFYDSAIGQVHGVDGALAVEGAMEGMWGLSVLGLSGIAGFLLCLPVAALAAWRAGLLRWWGAVAPVAGIVGGMIVLGANVPGWTVTTAGFLVLSIGLARAVPRDA
jgi:hypothetical protein